MKSIYRSFVVISVLEYFNGNITRSAQCLGMRRENFQRILRRNCSAWYKQCFIKVPKSNKYSLNKTAIEHYKVVLKPKIQELF